MASLPAGAGSAQGRVRLARELPPFLGGELRSPRGLPARVAKKGEEEWPQKVVSQPSRPIVKSSSRAAFDAPRELVWKAFTERERMAQWWGMKGLTTRVLELDLRPGGTFLYAMRMPDGREMCGSGSIAKSWRRSCSSSSILQPMPAASRSRITNPNLPPEMLTTTKFIDNGERTTMELRSVPTNETAAQREAFNKLADAMEEGFIITGPVSTNSSQRFDELRHSNEGEKTWVQQPISFQSPLIGCSSSRAFRRPAQPRLQGLDRARTHDVLVRA